MPRTLDPLERQLRRVALGHDGRGVEELPELDPKTRALVRLASLISLGAATTSYGCAVEVAYAAGATDEDVLGVLAAVAPEAGTARAVAAAPGLALALGYDVEDDLT